jgi:hypothetical protein
MLLITWSVFVSITVTVSASSLTLATSGRTGFTATLCGPASTGTSRSTVFVVVSMTETTLEVWSAT